MAHSGDEQRAADRARAIERATTEGETAERTDEIENTDAPNPPRTTTHGWLTVPKFGSAGSGGAELEPGPERD